MQAHDCQFPHKHTESHHGLIAASNLFWPEFVLHEDRVYLDDAPDADTYLELLLAADHDKTTVQALCNHRHLLDFFEGTDAAHLSRAELIEFGNRVQAMWQAKVDIDFPERDVVVAFDVEDEDPSDDLQLVVYEEEPDQ
jgi:hypothetical protein